MATLGFLYILLQMEPSLSMYLKIVGILACLVLSCMAAVSCGTTKHRQTDLFEAEYQLIDAFFKPIGNRGVRVLHPRTSKDKAWASLLEVDRIIDRMGLGTYVSDAEIKRLLTPALLDSIKTRIARSVPVRLDQEPLRHVRLERTADRSISMPIIIGDIAIFRRVSELDIPIHILRKENGQWKIIYTFYEKLILIESTTDRKSKWNSPAAY